MSRLSSSYFSQLAFLLRGCCSRWPIEHKEQDFLLNRPIIFGFGGGWLSGDSRGDFRVFQVCPIEVMVASNVSFEFVKEFELLLFNMITYLLKQDLPGASCT